MAGRAKQAGWPVVVFLLIAVVLYLRDQAPTESAGAGERGSEVGGYEKIDGCRWSEHRWNDGDSFEVELPDGRKEQVRLYFVDAPESAFKSYRNGENNHGRIADQARDLGVDSGQAVAAGKEAKRLVKRMLASGTFTIYTRWDDPFGDERYHAFVEAPGAGSPWLHERLVEEGLVRIHTKGAALPDGTSRNAQERELRGLESAARREKRGVWGE